MWHPPRNQGSLKAERNISAERICCSDCSMATQPSMSDFLNTEQGAAWLAITVDEWEQKILRAHSDVRQTSMQGLNGWLQARFRELHATEEGRILTSKLQDIDTSSLAGFQSTTLQLPILVTEEYVRSD